MPTYDRGQPRALNPDVNPWERQDGETSAAYAAFRRYLDSTDRVAQKATDGSTQGMWWAKEWRWGYRALEYDRYLARVDLEEAVRYRRTMNQRHRTTARAVQGAFVKWLNSADPTTFKPHEAIRFFEVSVRIEREAAGLTADDVEAALSAHDSGAAARNVTTDAPAVDLDGVPLETSPDALRLLKAAVDEAMNGGPKA